MSTALPSFTVEVVGAYAEHLGQQPLRYHDDVTAVAPTDGYLFISDPDGVRDVYAPAAWVSYHRVPAATPERIAP